MCIIGKNLYKSDYESDVGKISQKYTTGEGRKLDGVATLVTDLARGSESYKNPDSSSLQKPPGAGLATMGRLQLSKNEDRDRDPFGTKTCHRLGHWLKAIDRGKYRQLQCFQKCPNFGLNPNSDLCTRQS